MKRYFLIGFLILIFGFAGFAQNSPKKFTIEDFVWVKVLTDKTAIYVGDRPGLKLEIIYPKDWGIEILVDDLEHNSFSSTLPESLTLEKAEVSGPMVWQDYFVKIEAAYYLFYPEKKENTGIEFKPIKIRFKWIDPDNKEPQKDLKIYEVETKPFVLGVRSTLTPTSNQPRDSKIFFGKFRFKAFAGVVIGFVLILFVLSIPVRMLVRYFKNQRWAKGKISPVKLLKAEYKKLTAIQVLNPDQFCQILRRIVEIKTGIKSSAMTSAELKERVLDKDLAGLITILEKQDESRYNPAVQPDIEESKKELAETISILKEWTTSKFWKRLKKIFQKRKKDG